MTTLALKQMSQGALTATTTTLLYTAPAGGAIIKEILLCNTDTTARTVTMYVGAGSAAGQTVLSAVNVNPGETKFISLSTAMNASDTIKGGASTTAVVACTISGVELS